MSETEYKYKRWGLGALIGLAVVIIIAGIVIGVSLSASPKPTAEVASTETTQTVEQQQSEAERKAQEEEAARKRAEQEKMNQQSNNGGQTQQEIIDQHISTGNSMPKTGPEDAILPILGLAVVSTLLAYNVVMLKKNA